MKMLVQLSRNTGCCFIFSLVTLLSKKLNKIHFPSFYFSFIIATCHILTMLRNIVYLVLTHSLMRNLLFIWQVGLLYDAELHRQNRLCYIEDKRGKNTRELFTVGLGGLDDINDIVIPSTSLSSCKLYGKGPTVIVLPEPPVGQGLLVNGPGQSGDGGDSHRVIQRILLLPLLGLLLCQTTFYFHFTSTSLSQTIKHIDNHKQRSWTSINPTILYIYPFSLTGLGTNVSQLFSTAQLCSLSQKFPVVGFEVSCIYVVVMLRPRTWPGVVCLSSDLTI